MRNSIGVDIKSINLNQKCRLNLRSIDSYIPGSLLQPVIDLYNVLNAKTVETYDKKV